MFAAQSPSLVNCGLCTLATFQLEHHTYALWAIVLEISDFLVLGIPCVILDTEIRGFAIQRCEFETAVAVTLKLPDTGDLL